MEVLTSICLQKVAEKIGGKLVNIPNNTVAITGCAELGNGKQGDIVFVANVRYLPQLAKSHASAAIIDESMLAKAQNTNKHLPLILHHSPYLGFAKLSHLLDTFYQQRGSSIHPKAIISGSAKIGNNVTILAHAVIEEGALIGDHAVIGANCYVGAGVVLGESTFLHSNVVLYHSSQIGSQCIIHSGVVIGSDGFGYAAENGRPRKIYHRGRTRIENDVEIGSNTVVNRGTLGDTVIGADTKVDSNVSIAHNCKIGRNNYICARVAFGGSVTMGDFCMLGGGVLLKPHITIADYVSIIGGTVVNKSIHKKGHYGALPVVLEKKKALQYHRYCKKTADKLL